MISSLPRSVCPVLREIHRYDGTDGFAVVGYNMHAIQIKLKSRDFVKLKINYFHWHKYKQYDSVNLQNIFSHFEYQDVCDGWDFSFLWFALAWPIDNKLKNCSANELFKLWSNKSINAIQPSSQLSVSRRLRWL